MEKEYKYCFDCIYVDPQFEYDEEGTICGCKLWCSKNIATKNDLACEEFEEKING